jgi:gluconokinase
MKEYMIGVDIGTTSTKAVLFSKDGKLIDKANVEYPLYTKIPTAAEQDPEEIFRAVIEVIKELMSKNEMKQEHVLFVSFSSAMHSVIAIDENGKPLSPCITWADNRSTKWAKDIKNNRNGHEIYLRTGTPIHPMSPLTKILWIYEENRVLFDKTHKFIGIKEYVFFKLFHRYVIDHSIASATGLMNLKELDWDQGALEVARITRDHLSEIVPTTYSLKGIDQKYAQEMGLAETTPFIIGASDGVLSNLGVGAIGEGVVGLTIGTSGAIRTVVDKPVTDPKGRVFCYALTEKHWVIGGPVNNGGIIFRWIRDEFSASEVETAKRLGIDSYEVLSRIAGTIKPGSEGLIFHPYLAGERAPLWNADARGSFFGLAIHHKKEHLIRAALEGVLYNLYTVLLALKEITGMPKEINATGGFARSALWRQMLADIFDQDVIVPESFESSCLGAVVLGLYATGESETLDIVKGMIGTTHTHHPLKENVEIYQKLLPIYIRLSRVLEEEYESIADFQNSQLTE